ncbi:hypothetical protein ACFQHO_12115 [Actinomadura yumaensis]|uniref:hypothetical protein n=1 Tax=Actinomadura yumaensis TaxID=111807 RepID=UPI003619FF36
MGAVVLASVAPVAYVTGFAIFKTTAGRMPRLTGSRPFHTTRHLALDPVWLLGMITIVAGLVTQSLVLTDLPVRVVVPMYGPVLAVLLLVSIANFGERVQKGSGARSPCCCWHCSPSPRRAACCRTAARRTPPGRGTRRRRCGSSRCSSGRRC